MEAWYSRKLANLEGRKGLAYSDFTGANGTIQSIDLRVRRLEVSMAIETLPPMLVPAWDVLEYRIRQMDAKLTGPLFIPIVARTAAKTLCDVQTIARVILATPLYDAFHRPLRWPEDLSSKLNIDVVHGDLEEEKDKEEYLGFVAHRLCYLAGLRGRSVADFDQSNTAFVYELAVQVTLLGWIRPGYDRGFSVGGGVAAAAAKKSCCGCCSCHGHRVNTPAGAMGARRMQGFVSLHGHRGDVGCRGFAEKWKKALDPPRRWLGRLWCFGGASSAKSVVTTSSEEMID